MWLEYVFGFFDLYFFPQKLEEKLDQVFDKDSKNLMPVLMQAGQSDVEKLHGAMEVVVETIINNHEIFYLNDDGHFHTFFLQFFRALVRKKMCLSIFYVDATNR